MQTLSVANEACGSDDALLRFQRTQTSTSGDLSNAVCHQCQLNLMPNEGIAQ
jgi:hypothetical protein